MVSFVHDIVPVCLPDHSAFSKGGNTQFKNWLHFAVKHSSLIVCNSSFTKQQLGSYLSANRLGARIETARFPQEFRVSAARASVQTRTGVSDIVKTKYALCVGTIEIRKNIRSLLGAWKELLQIYQEETPTLVLAGEKGWGVDDVYQYLRETAHIGGLVKIVDKPNDAELELLYKNCQFSVFPSKFEGWGLPIGESLWFGKPVVCSNNASMPEVGGSFARYFDHSDAGSLLAALRNTIEKPVALPMNIRKHLTTWSETAASLYAAIDNLGTEDNTAKSVEHSQEPFKQAIAA